MKFTGKDGQLRLYERYGSYIEIHFSNMDFTSQLGRPAVEEKLILDRGIVNRWGHYIKGNDQNIFDPFGLSFSCSIDDVTHISTTYGWKEIIFQALICRNASNISKYTTWVQFGSSTKGQYSNKSGILNPRFEYPTGASIYSSSVSAIKLISENTWIEMPDAGHSYVDGELTDCIIEFTSGVHQNELFLLRKSHRFPPALYEMVIAGDIMTAGVTVGDTFNIYPNYRTIDIEYKLTGDTIDIMWAFQEVYFPPNEIIFTEAEDGLTLTATGGVYGPVVRAADWILPNDDI